MTKMTIAALFLVFNFVLCKFSCASEYILVWDKKERVIEISTARKTTEEFAKKVIKEYSKQFPYNEKIHKRAEVMDFLHVPDSYRMAYNVILSWTTKFTALMICETTVKITFKDDKFSFRHGEHGCIM